MGDPTDRNVPPKEAPPSEAPGEPPGPSREPGPEASHEASHEGSPRGRSGMTRPVERIHKLRLGVRAVWWSAVALALVFAGLAVWTGVQHRDPFALFYLALAGFCVLAGYGTLVAVRRQASR